MDCKEWIHTRAEEIASKQYDCGFYDLPEVLQRAVYNRAEEDHKSHLADQIDGVRERVRCQGQR